MLVESCLVKSKKIEGTIRHIGERLGPLPASARGMHIASPQTMHGLLLHTLTHA